MFVVSPDPVQPNEAISTGSPFWLRLWGQWVHLEGVAPGTSVPTARSRSVFESVDGVSWEQSAPRARRSWSFDVPWQSRVATRAFEVAAQSPAADAWLLDRTRAVVNMLAPDDCYGVTGAAGVLLTGGLPLPRFATEHTVTVPVRRGVATFVGLWADTSGPAATVTWPGGTATAIAPSGTTAQQAVAMFTPDADGIATIVAAAGTTGLQVTEDWLPGEWMAGQRTPCPVVVDDPAGVLHRMNAGAQALGSWSIELREVGA